MTVGRGQEILTSQDYGHDQELARNAYPRHCLLVPVSRAERVGGQ